VSLALNPLEKNGKEGNQMCRVYRLAAIAAFLCLFAGTAGAQAHRVHFRYVGGAWSHGFHAGWHRYWGGPSIGFYYAPTPVYTVPGYAAPSYYTGPSYWVSNPAFGISVNVGGGWHRGVVVHNRYFRAHRHWHR
jgi:hypothetical protein